MAVRSLGETPVERIRKNAEWGPTVGRCAYLAPKGQKRLRRLLSAAGGGHKYPGNSVEKRNGPALSSTRICVMDVVSESHRGIGINF